MARINLRVNGRVRPVDAEPDMPLLWVLRDLLNLTGTKYGCGIGQCGSCTVHLDGEAARSCQTAVSQVGERAVTTVEGLSPDGSHPVQQAWIAEDVPQCGYCQPGQVMTAAALLAANADPAAAEVDSAMSRNLCRCGTYGRIRAAVRRAAEEG